MENRPLPTNITEEEEELIETHPSDIQDGCNSDSNPEPGAGNKETVRRGAKRKLNETPEVKELTHILTESVVLQSQERADDPMGNKSFLMSLLPLMNSMPINSVIHLRFKIMELVNMYHIE